MCAQSPGRDPGCGHGRRRDGQKPHRGWPVQAGGGPGRHRIVSSFPCEQQRTREGKHRRDEATRRVNPETRDGRRGLQGRERPFSISISKGLTYFFFSPPKANDRGESTSHCKRTGSDSPSSPSSTQTTQHDLFQTDEDVFQGSWEQSVKGIKGRKATAAKVFKF